MFRRPPYYILGFALIGLSSCETDLLRGPSSQSRTIASPEALYPVNGQTMSEDRIEYSWQGAQGAVEYQLYVREGSSGASPKNEYKSPTLKAKDICIDGVCRFSPSFSPGIGHEHEYKVIALSKSGEAAVTTVQYKVTKTARPAKPVNIRPKHGETLELRSGIEFSWRPVKNAFSYDLLVYDRIAQKSVYRESFLGSKEVCDKKKCSVTPKLSITPGEDHYFRVIATTFNGQSDANYSAFHVSDQSEVSSHNSDFTEPEMESVSYLKKGE